MSDTSLSGVTLKDLEERISSCGALDTPEKIDLILRLEPYIAAALDDNEEKCMMYWSEFENVAINTSPEVKLSKRKRVEESFTCCMCGTPTCVYDSKVCELICTTCGICSNAVDVAPHWGTAHWESKDCRQVPQNTYYKRLTNLKTIMRNLQGYPSPLTPSVMSFVNRHRPDNTMTLVTLRKLLRAENVKVPLQMSPTILNSINPTYKLLKLSSIQLTTIVNRCSGILQTFKRLQKIGEIKRKNFLNYHYVIGQICTVLEYNHVLPYLTLPKGRATLKEHDSIWVVLHSSNK
jgi:hypothetical protein